MCPQPYQDDTTEYRQAEFLRDYASFTQPTTSRNGASVISGVESVAAKNQIADLEAEITQLREQLGKAKSLNDAMWDSVVQHVVNSKNDKGHGEGEKEQEGDPRRSKRSRGA